MLLAIALLFGTSAGAADLLSGIAKDDGMRLLQTCRAARALMNGEQADAATREDAALCIGFLEGFAWGHGWAAWRRGEDMYFCPPRKFSWRDAVPGVIAYLEAHPERLESEAHLLAFSALSEAFPCSP